MFCSYISGTLRKCCMLNRLYIIFSLTLPTISFQKQFAFIILPVHWRATILVLANGPVASVVLGEGHRMHSSQPSPCRVQHVNLVTNLGKGGHFGTTPCVIDVETSVGLDICLATCLLSCTYQRSLALGSCTASLFWGVVRRGCVTVSGFRPVCTADGPMIDSQSCQSR